LRCLERPHGQIRGYRLNWNERMGTGQNLGRLVSDQSKAFQFSLARQPAAQSRKRRAAPQKPMRVIQARIDRAARKASRRSVGGFGTQIEPRGAKAPPGCPWSRIPERRSSVFCQTSKGTKPPGILDHFAKWPLPSRCYTHSGQVERAAGSSET
jgi:hypothetical protein